MQTSLKHSKKFIVKLEELQKQWYEFYGKISNKNKNIEIFAKRNFNIRSPRYWFYLLHTTGAECWNLFVDFCVQELGSFNTDFSGFIFDEKANFEGFNFENVDFSNSFFKVPVSFEGAKFHKHANFSTCTFSKKQIFKQPVLKVLFLHMYRFQNNSCFLNQKNVKSQITS